MTRATTIGHRTALGMGALALTAAMLAPGAGAETAGTQGGNPEPGPVGGIGDPAVWGCFVGSTTGKGVGEPDSTGRLRSAHQIVFALQRGPGQEGAVAADQVTVTAVPRGADTEPVEVPFSFEGPVGTVCTSDLGDALGLEEGTDTSHVGEVDVTVTVDGTAEVVATLDMAKGGTPVDHRCENTNTESGPLWIDVHWTAVPMNMNDRGFLDGDGWAFTSDVREWMPFRWQSDDATATGTHYVPADEVEWTEHTPSVFPLHGFESGRHYGTNVSTLSGESDLSWIEAEGVGPDGKTYRRLSLIDPMTQKTYDATLDGAVPVAGMSAEDKKDMTPQLLLRDTQPEDPNEAADDGHTVPDKVETGASAAGGLTLAGLGGATGLVALRRRFGMA